MDCKVRSCGKGATRRERGLNLNSISLSALLREADAYASLMDCGKECAPIWPETEGLLTIIAKEKGRVGHLDGEFKSGRLSNCVRRCG